MGRYFAVALIFSCVTVNGLVSGLVYDCSTHKAFTGFTTQNNSCTSSECYDTAMTVMSKIKPAIDPCDNFYQFACGTYIDKVKIPKDKMEVNAFSEISNNLTDVIAMKRPTTDPKYLRLPYAFYSACMNEPLIETLDSKPIHRIAKQLGGWPVIEGKSWDGNNLWTWQNAVRKSRRLGLGTNYLIDFSIGEDLKDSNKLIIKLDQPSLGLRRTHFIQGLTDRLVSAYRDIMVDFAVLFKADREIAMKELQESLDFEIELSKITLPDENRLNPSDLYNLRSIKQLQEEYPYVHWLDYINALLPKGLKVNENESVNLATPSYFEKLGELLKATKKRTIANYMMWRIYASAVPFLSEKFRNKQRQIAEVLAGPQKPIPRINECLKLIINSLTPAVSSLYIRKHFNQTSKVNVLELTNNARDTFSKMLDEVEWMDAKTKQFAKKKLRSMITHIGFTDELLDDKKLGKFYCKLNIDSYKYYESYLRTNVFRTDYLYKLLRQPVNKVDWTKQAPPYDVNSYYLPTANSIQFPAGILQGVFFNAHRPRYMNYGAIGSIIGHEIIHGFDPVGSQHDEQGYANDWWQPFADTAYWKKAECAIKQYANYTDKQTGLNLNGFSTQNENLADNGGIKMSYLAYTQWANKNAAEPQLPGLICTPKQMFWISAAQTWCAKYQKEMRITYDFHSPHEFRVLGPLSNMKEFSSDFKCPAGAPMNPAQKCQVW